MSGHAKPSDLKKVEELRRRVSERPEAESLVALGALLFEPLHSAEEAVRILNKAIKLDPKSVDARFWLAKVLVHEYVDEKGAKSVLEEALGLDPNRADRLLLMASVLRGLGSSAQGYVCYLRRAAEQAPDWPSSHGDLAQALLELGKVEQAEAEIHEALARLVRYAVPEGATEEYYETAVSGRFSPAEQRYLEELSRRIKRAKRAKDVR